MKFKFKVEFLYLLYLVLPFFIATMILSLSKSVVFSLKEAIIVVIILYLPIFIISLIFIFTSYCTVDDKGINIYYAGFLERIINFCDIENIEETEAGFNFLALANSKLKINVKGESYIFAIKEKDLFLETYYKNNIIE
ncbi:hypothetical protein [Acetivibrio clariflavus]|uniref:PH domain-containing protein n=1 Tax=Acetivibrio clariflavus (strain DSM 19732 / NBRC 101661 / EBR45) TaxID=720554 RepID=G8LXG5_ACECE|nr:hypothetical protein [Acetivibrio clariflavus]AEV69883.1 hypothetical protein Clocl_3385 [Acetivibrio clariflavus DSM 19732]